jgi:predicted nucleic acid-binding protein
LRTYLDSSTIVSLHVSDSNSNSARLAVTQLTLVPLISTLGQLEVVNALSLKAFRKEISSAEASLSIQKFTENLQRGAYELRPIPEQAFVRALQLSQTTTQRMGTKSADILHIAAALELGAKAFFSFDEQQRKLAETVGLTLNPS